MCQRHQTQLYFWRYLIFQATTLNKFQARMRSTSVTVDSGSRNPKLLPSTSFKVGRNSREQHLLSMPSRRSRSLLGRVQLLPVFWDLCLSCVISEGFKSSPTSLHPLERYAYQPDADIAHLCFHELAPRRLKFWPPTSLTLF